MSLNGLMDDGPFLGAQGPFPTPNPSVGVVVAVPALTNAADGTPTSDGATGSSVDTDVGDGTLYWAVLTNGGSATDAEIKAGTGGDIVDSVAGAQGVSGTGTQTIGDITGLEPETDYEIVFLQTNSIGSDSAQATVALLTTA